MMWHLAVVTAIAPWAAAVISRLGLTFAALVLGLTGLFWIKLDGARRGSRRERRCREEIEAYLRLDVRMNSPADFPKLAERVCPVVAARSPFPRVGMLGRGADGRLYLAASVGLDGESIASIEAWADHASAKERSGAAYSGGVKMGARSMVILLGEHGSHAIATPFWADGNRMMGALIVLANNVFDVQRRSAAEAVVTLEALGIKLGKAIEKAEMGERLIKAEKLAGLGLLAGGVAHSLNNPLTAVTGYAELIAETASEERVRTDALTILSEACRMRETVESLQNFWRPLVRRREPIDLVHLINDLSRACQQRLVDNGIRLVVQAADHLPVVHGNVARLRLVFEHLMNNAAQAIAAARQLPPAPSSSKSRDDVIRLTLSCVDRSVQMIVSDTGSGFRDPRRVFDPFYTTSAPGSGLGLSICYGIVREHQGEISAFNLHPTGAAVVVELPVSEVVRNESPIVEVA